MAVVIRHSDEMEWTASPTAGVWRKRLEHVGPAESGRVTSVVRFDAGAMFPRHPHPEGEEIFVIDGDLSTNTTTIAPIPGSDSSPATAIARAPAADVCCT